VERDSEPPPERANETWMWTSATAEHNIHSGSHLCFEEYVLIVAQWFEWTENNTIYAVIILVQTTIVLYTSLLFAVLITEF
jgi:hypothetical protein